MRHASSGRYLVAGVVVRGGNIRNNHVVILVAAPQFGCWTLYTGCGTVCGEVTSPWAGSCNHCLLRLLLQAKVPLQLLVPPTLLQLLLLLLLRVALLQVIIVLVSLV